MPCLDAPRQRSVARLLQRCSTSTRCRRRARQFRHASRHQLAGYRDGDGYTSFVSLDSEAIQRTLPCTCHERVDRRSLPGERSGDPTTWRYPAIEQFARDSAVLPSSTSKSTCFRAVTIMFCCRTPGSPVRFRHGHNARSAPLRLRRRFPIRLWATSCCLRRLTRIEDDNYWDPLHYRALVADRLARDTAAAVRGEASDDYRVLAPRMARRVAKRPGGASRCGHSLGQGA